MKFLHTVSLNEARRLLLDASNLSLITEQVPLTEALGRYLARDLVSAVNVPAFVRSTVDGYAIKAKESFGASSNSAIPFQRIPPAIMGQLTTRTLEAGQAMYVPTGGSVPAGADAMVMIEHTASLADLILVEKAAAPGDHLVPIGDDVQVNDLVLKRGHRLKAQDLGVLAALGNPLVEVFQLPKVFILSSGDEIRGLQEELESGSVYDINSYSLAAMAQAFGLNVVGLSVIKDDLEALSQAVSRAKSQADIVLLSGGSSQGEEDYSRQAMEKAGGQILFHGIRIKPGKPTIGAVAGEKLMIGLPGHPVSALMLMDLLVVHHLEEKLGLQSQRLKILAETEENFASVPGKTTCQFVTLRQAGMKTLCKPYLAGSALITQLTKAQGYILLAEDVEGLDQGQNVEVTLL